MKFRREISTAHPAVAGPRRRRTRSAFLDLLLEGAGLADTLNEPSDIDAECREWADRADELAECAELLRSGGYTDHASPLPLHSHEQVFFVLNDARLVEGRAGVADAGTVTITDKRVVFQSIKQAKQFRHSALLAYHHDETEPVTYFDASHADAAIGIRYGAATSFRFRMRLAVAHAWAAGERAALAPALDAELVEHLTKRPNPLPVN